MKRSVRGTLVLLRKGILVFRHGANSFEFNRRLHQNEYAIAVKTIDASILWTIVITVKGIEWVDLSQ